jgi:hypothetical protein
MKLRFVNRVSALITSTVASTDLVVHLETGAGARLPILGSNEGFRATLISADGSSEYVNGVAVVGDAVTVERSQEGSAAISFAVGSRFELRLTAGVAEVFLQRTGDTMTGDLDMANHKLLRADLSSTPVRFNQIHAGLIRSPSVASDAPYVGSENAIYIPPDNGPTLNSRRPGYMGRPIVNTQMFDAIAFDAWIDVNNVPPHFKLCDGSLGTPDLRGKFIKGWTATFGVGGQGGAEVGITTVDGVHNHSGATAGAALSVDQLPPHQHTETSLGAAGGGTSGGGNLGSITRQTGVTGSGNPHAHGIYTDPGHQHAVLTQPPFFVMAKVMFNI